MRRIIPTVLLCFTLLSGMAQVPASDSAPALSLEQTEHNFGKIPERGRRVEHEFFFTNTGDRPLVITRAASSCRCVGTSYTKKPIPPGGQGILTVTYDPKKQQGVFRKGIQVFSNAPEGMHVVIVRGEVITEE